MIDPKHPITGVVSADSKDYVFYLNDYCLEFLDNDNSRGSSVISPIDGFVHAKTHSKTEIWFYMGKHDFPVVNTMKFHIGSFLMSTANMMDYDLSFFDGIVFVGGTLKKLKTPNEIKFEYDEESGRKYIVRNDDSQKFSFQTSEFHCNVEIGSSTSESSGTKGVFLSNDKVYFNMMFDKAQSTLELYKHYNKIKELLSFLTFRDNVGFDEIYLVQNNTTYGKNNVARVYIKDEELTSKVIHHNLTFKHMDGYLSEALRILYETTDKKRSYSLNIYPENDKKETIITNEMVREVCSALECEIGFIEKIQSDESAKIKDLIKKIKPIIKAHKQSEDQLKEKTYSLIESSMSHWSMAASDQIKALFHMYDEEMLLLNHSDKFLGDDEIDEFVKYRNDITHGSYRVMDYTIANMTHLLSGLVYCAFLTRIGMPRDQITKLCKENRLIK